MIDEGANIPELLDILDASSIKVHAPSLVIFVCGGAASDVSKPPKSLRDAFLRIWPDTPLRKYHYVVAEAEDYAPPRGQYAEVLEFETDIAQLSELLLLFSESPGSFAELGAFVMDGEVAPRVVVIIDDHNYHQDSFIKWGPLYTLAVRHGEACICVIPLKEIGVASIRDVSGINLKSFRDILETPLTKRLEKNKGEPRTFDPKRSGHLTKLIVGLIQHYYALTLEEVRALLVKLDIELTPEQVRKHLMCAEIFRWVYSERRGVENYYAAIADKSAIAFEAKKGSDRPDPIRWRTDIRAYWKSRDVERFKVIAEAAVRSGR